MDYPVEKFPDYYSLPLRCINCQSHFKDTDPSFYPNKDVVPQQIYIAKGTKISDIKCPICGCQTLCRWID